MSSIRETAFVGLFSIYGTILRLFVDMPCSLYPICLYNSMYSNTLACFLAGFVCKFFLVGEIWIGITIGFLGSLSTYSSWQIDIILDFVVNVNILRGLYALMIGIILPMCSFIMGTHLAEGMKRKTPIELKLTDRQYLIILLIAYPATIIGCIVGFIISTMINTEYWLGVIWISGMVGPIGACIRYIICKSWNEKGVFFVNVLGTIISLSFLILYAHETHKWNLTEFNTISQIIKASIIYGGCGSFTTVSSWVTWSNTIRDENESSEYTISISKSYGYGFLMIMTSQIISLSLLIPIVLTHTIITK